MSKEGDTQATQQQIADKIKKNIKVLKNTICKYSTESVVGYCMVNHITEQYQHLGLTSPAKQILFLLGILVDTEEPHDSLKFSEKDWPQIVKPLQAMFNAYFELYFSVDDFDVGETDHSKEIKQVSMLAFFNHFHQTVLASVEQVIERINKYVTPFDDTVSTHFGISATDALNIAEWISNELENSIDDFRNGDYSAVLHIGKITRQQLLNEFGVKGERFWELFTIGRGEGVELKYPTDRSLAEQRPLIRLSDDVAMVFNLNMLFISILARNEEFLSSCKYKKEYFDLRDTIVEDQAADIFRRLLGKDAKIYRSLCELPNGNNEHDIVVVINDLYLFVEAKASPLGEPFRDPTKAFIRIRDFFRSDVSIQKAYEQALRLLHLVKTQETTILYNKKGEEKLRLSQSIANKVFCIAVTRDSYGPLATDLSLLLEKNKDDPYPWAVNLLDLGNIAEAWNYLHWDERQLKTYLSHRIQLHRRVFSDDELEYVGAFIQHCGLHHFIKGSDTFVQLAPGYSDVFDRIHAHLAYGAPAVKLNPTYPVHLDARESFRSGSPTFVDGSSEGSFDVGRNEKCPCGSSVKFKRCHGNR